MKNIYKQNVIIIGGNGFVGSNLIEFLSQNKINAINIKSNTSQMQILKIFKENKIKCVVNCAVNYGFDNNYYNVISTNVLLPVKFIQICKNYKVKYFINLDSCLTKEKYKNYDYLKLYVNSKLHLLEYFKMFSENDKSLKIINIPIEYVYGKNENKNKLIPSIIEKLRKNEAINLTKGLQRRDFIYIKDVVDAIYKIIKYLDKIENTFTQIPLGTGVTKTIKTFIVTLKKVIMSESKLNFGLLKYRKNEIFYSCSDIEFLNKINWKPKYDIESGLKDYL